MIWLDRLHGPETWQRLTCIVAFNEVSSWTLGLWGFGQLNLFGLLKRKKPVTIGSLQSNGQRLIFDCGNCKTISYLDPDATFLAPKVELAAMANICRVLYEVIQTMAKAIF